MLRADANFKFPKSQRLKSSQQIRKIVASRQSVSQYPIKCFFQIDATGETYGQCRVAMLVSKRKFKHAVDRNRVKRLFREAFRLNIHLLQIPNGTALSVCWMFVGDELPVYNKVDTAAKAVFSKINTLLSAEKCEK